MKLSLLEAEVVANINDGLGSSQLSCLVFQKAPVTYTDLDRLCVHDHSRISDNLRNQNSHCTRVSTAERTNGISAGSAVGTNVASGNNILSGM
jgi:hypothetical protein